MKCEYQRVYEVVEGKRKDVCRCEKEGLRRQGQLCLRHVGKLWAKPSPGQDEEIGVSRRCITRDTYDIEEEPSEREDAPKLSTSRL